MTVDPDIARRLVRPRIMRPFVPIDPTPKQHAAMLCQSVFEIMYGGAGGGGKSVWLLAEAAAFVDQPGYAAILFRRNYPNLTREPDGLIPMSHAWFRNTPARWIAETRTWKFPSGAVITFGHLENPRSHANYAGPSYQMVGFDEVTEIRPAQFEFMQTRMRRLKTSGVPIRLRMASNPGGEHHDYYANRFGLDGRGVVPSNRLYIPAYVWDNPHMDADEYAETLSRLPDVLRRRILEGDWSVDDAGFMFKTESLDVVSGMGPDGARRVRVWDLAAEADVPGSSNDPDWTAGVRMAMDDDRVWIEDVVRMRTTPDESDATVMATAARDGRGVVVGFEQEFGAAGKRLLAFWRRALPQYRVEGFSPSGSKTERARGFASAVGDRRVVLCDGPWVDDFVRELARFPNAPHDDQVDSASYGFNWLDRRRPVVVSRASQRSFGR